MNVGPILVWGRIRGAGQGFHALSVGWDVYPFGWAT